LARGTDGGNHARRVGQAMLTVLLATDGDSTLPAVLESYGRLTNPRGGWKLVVVGNTATDVLRERVTAFASRLPLTYVFEPRIGKNYAVNAGLPLIDGDLVVFTDDDAFPAADWLVQLRDAADRRPAFTIFGGRVVPRWESLPPAWILAGLPLAWTYTISDPRLNEGPVSGRHVFGPNMAIRSDVFRAGQRFVTSIGPDGTSDYAMGSETEFILRLEKAGARAWYAPAARVEHFVRTRQMNAGWLFGRARRAGRCEYRLGSHAPVPALGYQVLRKLVALLAMLVTVNPSSIVRRMWDLCFLYGQIREAVSGRPIGGNRTPIESGL